MKLPNAVEESQSFILRPGRRHFLQRSENAEGESGPPDLVARSPSSPSLRARGARRAMYPSPLNASTSALAFFAEGSGFGLKTEPSRPQKDEGAPPPPRPVYSHHTGPASDARGQPRPHRACPRAREVGKFCDQISHREQTHRRTVLLPQV